MKLKQKCSLLKRGLSLQWSLNRDLFLANGLLGMVQALGPLATVWFSARLIDELTGAGRANMLLLWAASAVIFNVMIMAVKSICSHRVNRTRQLANRRISHLFAEKIMSLDFEDVEDSRVRDLLMEIEQNENYNGLGLSYLCWELDKLVSGLTAIVAGVGLTITLFTSAATMNGYIVF